MVLPSHPPLRHCRILKLTPFAPFALFADPFRLLKLTPFAFRLSFKGTLDTLRHWSPLIAAEKAPRQQGRLIDKMLGHHGR